jgi:tetratricopeptide (TPR) repeat protein
METDNLVVKLCLQGMEAETTGEAEEARRLFEQAWAASQNEYEACVAAHYLARHQDTPQAMFEWNREALNRADAVNDERVRGFYSSLYLNLGHSYETLGNLIEARKCYELATAKLNEIPEGAYKEIVRTGINGGCRRTESLEQ